MEFWRAGGRGNAGAGTQTRGSGDRHRDRQPLEVAGKAMKARHPGEGALHLLTPRQLDHLRTDAGRRGGGPGPALQFQLHRPTVAAPRPPLWRAVGGLPQSHPEYVGHHLEHPGCQPAPRLPALNRLQWESVGGRSRSGELDRT